MNISSTKISFALLIVTALTSCNIEDNLNSGALITDRPFAYIERSMPAVSATYTAEDRAPLDVRSPYAVNSGAKLLSSNRITSDADTVDVLANYFGSTDYDVKDLDTSVDGTKLIFAAHGPEQHTTDNSWNIYIFDFVSQQITRVIADDELANAADDTSPVFTNDGHVVFSSNRQAGRFAADGQTITDFNTDPREYLLQFNEPASLLHRMSVTGGDIEQITYGNYHDVKATVMDDGMVVFLRWGQHFELINSCILDSENPEFFVHLNGGGWGHGNGSGFPDGLSDPKDWSEEQKCEFATSIDGQATLVTDVYGIYRTSPTGSYTHRFFGDGAPPQDDSAFLQFIDPMEAGDGNLVSIVRHLYNPMFGGDLVVLDTNGVIRNSNNDSETSLFNGVQESMSPGDVQLYPGQISPAGWYSAAWPYDDGTDRLLTSWSQCLMETDGIHQPCNSDIDSIVSVKPRYGIWAIDPSDNTRLPVVRAKEGILVSEIAIGQLNANARPHSMSLENQMAQEGYATIHLHSVYDLDGNDMASTSFGGPASNGITSFADPTQSDFDQRSERFVQVIAHKDVPTALKDELSPSQLFGAGAGPMWDILSYAPIQPDGSAIIKVPGKKPTDETPTFFTFRIVNGYGKNVEPLTKSGDTPYLFDYLNSHSRALALDAGFYLECGGCHDPSADNAANLNTLHTKFENLNTVANQGGLSGSPFTNTNPTIVVQNDGATMAETLGSAAINVKATADMVYADHWNHDGVGDTPVSISARYVDLNTELPLNNADCVTQWQSDCRVTINYKDHIQALWELPRQSIADAEGNGIVGREDSCVGCHQKAGTESGIPKLGQDGDFILEGSADAWNPDHVASYVQLFNAREYFHVINGVEMKENKPLDVDANGDYVNCSDFVDPPQIDNGDDTICYARRLMSARGAIASANFFTMFDNDPDDDQYAFNPSGAGNAIDHKGFLSSSELKLIAEWLDTGAHYYNDPVKAAEDFGITLDL